MTCGAQELIELVEPVERSQKSRLTGSKDSSPLQDLFLTRQLRGFAARFCDRLGDPLAGQHFLHARQVFLRRRLLRAFLSLRRQAGSQEQSLDKSNMTEGDRK